MIDTRFVLEFVSNPFPDEKQARELLAAIESRQISDREFARFLFCFQIAFYFLAWLAISEQDTDSSLKKDAVDEAHNQLRAFYAKSSSKVAFSDFIVSPSEQDSFIAVLRQQLNESDGAHIDISGLTTSKLTLFDLVGVSRLREYYDAMDQPNLHKFYVVAERILFHYGAKKYQSMPVMLLANILLGNYGIATKIVTPVPHSGDAERDEKSNSAGSILFTPSIPDITKKRPIKAYAAGAYAIFIVEDVAPVGGGNLVKYKYALAVVDRRKNLPVCFVTLENSPFASNVLGVFERDGSHSNYGALNGANLAQEFASKGLNLVRERFDLGALEELELQRARKSWWKFW